MYFLSKNTRRVPALLIVLFYCLCSCGITLPTEEEGITEKASACAAIRAGEKIDENTEENMSFPNVGLVKFSTDQNQSGICTGTLVAPNAVLTAGHCIKDNEGQLYARNFMSFQINETDPIRGVKKIIPWKGKIYRDVALLILEESYNEIVPYYSLMQGPINRQAGTEMTMVGFGGYTDGNDINTFSAGQKRYGKARFNGYTEDSSFGYKADYLWMLPGGKDKLQTICQGDSGSSLFVNDDNNRMIGGVASLGGVLLPENTNNPSKAHVCHYSIDSLYVPSSSIYDWLQDSISDSNKNSAKSEKVKNVVFQATIVNISSGAQSQVIKFENIDIVDSGFLFAGDSFDFCVSKCEKLPTLNGTLYEGRLVEVVLGSGKDDKIWIERISSPSQDNVEKSLTAKGTIADVSPLQVEKFGRKYLILKLAEVDFSLAKSEYFPTQQDLMEIIFCTEGCSQNISIRPELLSVGNRLSIVGDVIENEGFFVRAVADNEEPVCELSGDEGGITAE